MEVTLNKELMFAGGRLNEDHWLSALKTAYTGPILCEEEISTGWQTEQGVWVTGRPDIVLCSPDNTEEVIPTCGIELKQIMSTYMAKEVLLERRPSMKHLMQAAHYMWQLNCPFELWYTNRCSLDLPSWFAFFAKTPRPGQENSDLFRYRYYRLGDINRKSGKPTRHKITEQEYKTYDGDSRLIAEPSKILPFIYGFKLELREGTLWYKDDIAPNSSWQETIITIERIQRFYNFVGELEQYGKVPSRYLNILANGDDTGFGFDTEDLPLELRPENNTGNNLKEWVDRIKELR